MTVFLDANVLFSAAVVDSPTRRLLDVIITHACAVTNEHAWEEAKRNLERKRPQWLDSLERLRHDLVFSMRTSQEAIPYLCLKDQPILGGAIAAKCTHLWTGDKRHFGHLYGRVIAGTTVVSGIMLADEMAAARWL